MDALQFMLIDLEPRHLPGKHNQANHGKGSGPVTDYDAITPGKGKTPASATKSMQSTSDGRKLTTITKKWQGQSGQVEAIQRDFMIRANGKSTGNPRRDEHMDLMMKGIKNSPTNPETLYRGVRLPKSTDPNSLVGQSVVMGPSSFSTKQGIAKHFVDRKQEASTTVIYRMGPGKGRGLPVELFGDSAYKYEAETISAGQFKVTGVEKVRGGFIADIEHTAMFSWGE